MTMNCTNVKVQMSSSPPTNSGSNATMSDSTNRWFQRTNSETTIFEPIWRLNEDRHGWTLAKLGLHECNNAPITTFISDSADFYNFSEEEAHQSITELTQRDKSATAQDKAQSQAYLAATAYKNWKTDRETKKARKLGAGIQSFLCTVGDFLKSFSSVAEIVKSADQQFGGLAYGTVALVAAVAVLKQQREESIERVLEELSHAFPRLNTLQELNPGPELKQLIISVFELAIIFCRETITYFTEPRRLIKAISPGEIKMETVCKLRVKLLEVRKECEILMLQKLEDVTSELRHIRLDLQETTVRLEVINDTTKNIKITGLDTNLRVQENQRRLRQDAESRAKNKALSELKGQLQLKNGEEQPILNVASSVKRVLTAEFSQRRRKARGPRQQISEALLMQDGDFLSWSENKNSTMLLLAGDNYGNRTSVESNWLSGASVWAVENMRQTNDVLAVFCQPSYTITERTRRSFASVVKCLVYQLAEHHPTGLRLQHDLVREALSSIKWDHEEPATAFEHMLDLLSALMEQWPTEKPILMVIDRLDQCRWSNESRRDCTELEDAVISLLHMMRNQSSRHPKLKILLVMDKIPAKHISKALAWAVNEKLLNCKMDWDQMIDKS